ncbi:YopX family protein [Bacillus infantis]|uniref:YopX family protein n=1 Tax=Bacillus infantis TaxID=324767 RepID=UPI00344D98FA
MPREYKFRGMDLLTGEWVYGSLIKVHHTGTQAIGMIDDMGYLRTYEVDRSTVGQYTGLNDKSGQEIYEGDITLVENETAWVTFDDGCFCLLGYLGDGRTYPIRDSMFSGKELEVIGNMQEHPELLESAG